jgi:hypothetical protein
MPSRPLRWLVVGLVLVVAAVTGDPFLGRPMDLGAVQLGMLATGVLLAVLALGAHRPALRRATFAVTVLTAATYGTLVVLELTLALFGPPRATRDPLAALRGMVIEDPAVGFRLAPRWHGHYDDGIAQAEYETNARGDRDDEAPLAGASRSVLLLGDSFTFGQALPRAQTIEARIEARAGGSVDAYDLGVPGYSAVHALRRFEQSTWWRGQDVVYLFFNNDVHPGSHVLDYMRVIDGYAVPRRRPDGTAYAEDELRARLHGVLAADPERLAARIGARLGLQRLRRLVANIRDPELRRSGLPADAFDPGVVDEVVGHVRDMQALAAERGARLHVVVIPTPAEVADRAWSRSTAAFVAATRAAALDPVEVLLERLEVDDYLAHDGHFAAGGADEVAALVLELLERPAG